MKNTASRGIVSRMSNAFIFAGCFLVAFMLFLAVFGWHITTPWSSDYNQLGLSIVYGTTHALFLLGILIRIGLFLPVVPLMLFANAKDSAFNSLKKHFFFLKPKKYATFN